MERGYTPKNNDWSHVYNGEVTMNKQFEKKTFGRINREGYPIFNQFGTTENPFGDTTSVDLACDVIDNYESDDPFFLFVGTVGPHDPYFPPQEFLDIYKETDISLPLNYYDNLLDKPNLYRRTQERLDLTVEEHIESLRRYYAFCSYEDSLFGKVLNSVNNKGIFEDTVIIYLTDHGDYMGAHKLWAKSLPCFKEAYNICSVIGGGGIKGNKIDDHFISLTDFAPTILDLAKIDSDINFFGKSLVPLLNKENNTNWRQDMFTQTNGNEVYGIQRSVWNKKYKYVFNSFDYDELYDLEDDPLEMKNIAKDSGSDLIIREMCIKMWQYAKETNDTNTCPYILTSLAPYGPGIIL